MAPPGRGDSAFVIERTLRQEFARLILLEETDGGRIVGTSWITCDGRRQYLHHFAIRPDLQGRGLGRALLAEVVALARAVGLQLKLEVYRGNARAQDLYRRSGFTSPGDIDILMMREYGR